MEVKSLPGHIKNIADREVTGIFAVFGNIDSYRDRLWPGAFAKTLQERSGRIQFLWQHDFSAPAIAIIKSVHEVGREELPDEVLRRAPEALGGAEVVREYLPTPRADEILAGLKAGAPYEMSFGYDPVKYDFEEDPDATYEWDKIRNLREVRLYEISDVLWGANDATLAAKAALPLPFLLKQLELHTKAGARHSKQDIALLNAIHRAAVDLGATQCKGILEDETNEDDAKSRAGPGPLTLLRQRLQLLDLEVTT